MRHMKFIVFMKELGKRDKLQVIAENLGITRCQDF